MTPLNPRVPPSCMAEIMMRRVNCFGSGGADTDWIRQELSRIVSAKPVCSRLKCYSAPLCS